MSTNPAGSGQLVTLPPASTVVSGHSQQAWHLFSLIFSLRRPASPHELASLCKLFPAPPELVRFLCGIPYSPICLIDGNRVSVSPNSLAEFRRLLSSLNLMVKPPSLMRIEKTYYRKRKRSASEDEILPLVKRRADLCSDEGAGDWSIWRLAGGIQDPRSMGQSLNDGDVIISGRPLPGFASELKQMLPFSDVAGQSIWQLESPGIEECQDGKCRIEEILVPSNIEMSGSVIPIISHGTLRDEAQSTGNKDKRGCFETEDFAESSRIGTEKTNSLFKDIGSMNDGYKFKQFRASDDGIAAKLPQQESCSGHSSSLRELQYTSPVLNTSLINRQFESEAPKKNEVKYDNVVCLMDNQEKFRVIESSPLGNPSSRPNSKSKSAQGAVVSSRMLALRNSLEKKKVDSVFRDNQQLRKSQKLINAEKKVEHANSAIPGPERRERSVSVSPRDQPETKVLPEFESYVVEVEEGSGGYGTVYRACRRTDGRIVAIKYPHAKAHKHHIVNELKMLERFGGKNFIIKYEGCFKSGSADCFVLEHVQHDRPEVLKKEIGIYQLQWYGYCLFRALASLHKKGVVHRDVKPGNFLFSRKANKGYLIDFNLALDLHQKHATKNKLKLANVGSFDSLPLSNAKSRSPSKLKSHGDKLLHAVRKDGIKVPKFPYESKSMKRKFMDQSQPGNDLGSWNSVRSQGAEGSGITSAKDVTSTRTASAERMREPLPRQGRKELISLLQKTMHTNSEASSAPSSIRKRVAAPPAKVHDNLMVFTPMPVNSSGLAVCGAGFTKGDHKKEGPCVGTKGFRAPEVLFRSLHQGPKLDIWSAGVTLLYLIIGKMPFLGEPEQNIKDIAKLRGSEDLWEVAKLHNREPSFPMELYDTRHLMGINIRDWCRRNTRRPEFLDAMPISLFDLLDKCLTVNPRARISAEEALRHEFFVTCHEELRKQKLLKLEYSQEAVIGNPLNTHTSSSPPLKV